MSVALKKVQKSKPTDITEIVKKCDRVICAATKTRKRSMEVQEKVKKFLKGRRLQSNRLQTASDDDDQMAKLMNNVNKKPLISENNSRVLKTPKPAIKKQSSSKVIEKPLSKSLTQTPSPNRAITAKTNTRPGISQSEKQFLPQRNNQLNKPRVSLQQTKIVRPTNPSGLIQPSITKSNERPPSRRLVKRPVQSKHVNVSTMNNDPHNVESNKISNCAQFILSHNNSVDLKTQFGSIDHKKTGRKLRKTVRNRTLRMKKLERFPSH